MGPNNSRLCKVAVSGCGGLSGLMLGAAFGVQTGMNKLGGMEGRLGEELRVLEALREQLRRRGTQETSQFTGEAAEAERERLKSTTIDR